MSTEYISVGFLYLFLKSVSLEMCVLVTCYKWLILIADTYSAIFGSTIAWNTKTTSDLFLPQYSLFHCKKSPMITYGTHRSPVVS